MAIANATTGFMPELLADFGAQLRSSDPYSMIRKLLEPRPELDFDTAVIPTKLMGATREAMHDMHTIGLGAIKVVASDLIEPVCAVQVDPKFPWITPEGRARINAKFEATFGKTQDVAYLFNAEVLRDFQLGMRDKLDKHCAKLLMGEE